MFKVVFTCWLNIAFTIVLTSISNSAEDQCYTRDEKCTKGNIPDDPVSYTRYLFYDVNPPEGFNLRRDVYMRFAVFAHKLQKSQDPRLNVFKLVLPPWSHMHHWGYSSEPQQYPWSLYFDLKSLQLFAPVIEMHEFFSSYGNKNSPVIIDQVYTLQHYEDMFVTGDFSERFSEDICDKKYEYNFFYYNNITAINIKCLSFHGPATLLRSQLQYSEAKTILFNHGEVALHETFGSVLYWKARRSMRFNKDLRKIAADYRRKFLDSTDEADKTILPELWTEEMSNRRAIGGPYIAIHLRRRDFIRKNTIAAPTVEDVVQQIRRTLQKLMLNVVYIATDGPPEEFQKIVKRLPQYQLFKYTPPIEVIAKYGEGGVAIIDQIICSHARYFIGTHDSTFSFRIQEEREILGFPVDTTFNALCKEDDKDCKKPSVWKIVYPN